MNKKLIAAIGAIIVSVIASIIFKIIEPGIHCRFCSPPPIVYREELDNWFGANNWFCYPDRQDGVGVTRNPRLFVVPGQNNAVGKISFIETTQGKAFVGLPVSGAGGATVQFSAPYRTPRSECPAWQQVALQQWDADSRAVPGVELNKIFFDNMFGAGNWRCHPDPNINFAVIPSHISSLTVKYPMTNVDAHNGLKYGVGQQVPAGPGATVWVGGQVAKAQCP